MKKIINPVRAKYPFKNLYLKTYEIFVMIEYENGNLSFNSNCVGNNEPNFDEILSGIPAENWNRAMVQKLVEVWKEWNHNNARPYCEHQKALGWKEIATKQVNLYNFELTNLTILRRKLLIRQSKQADKRGEISKMTSKQIELCRLPYYITYHSSNLPEHIRKYYKPQRSFGENIRSVKTELLGNLRPDQHPNGILHKPCQICGHKYGSDFSREEVPDEIIKWLFESLPNAKEQPTWI